MPTKNPAQAIIITQLAAGTPLSEEVSHAFYSAMRHSGSVAVAIESIAIRAIEQGETHMLDDIANLASHLSESLRLLAIALTNLKTNG